MNRKCNKLWALICILSCFLISGCADGQFGLTFNKDGTITQKNSLEIQQSYKDLGNYFGQTTDDIILEQKREDMQDGFIVDDIPNGYTATKTYMPEELAGIKFFQPNEKADGLQIKKGFLHDYYSIDAYIKGQYQPLPQADYAVDIPSFFSPSIQMNIWDYLEYRRQAEAEARQLNEISNQMVKAAIGSMNLNLVINVPYAVDYTNADNLSNDNKTLTWNVKPIFLEGKDLVVKAKFRIYHEKTIIALIVIGAVLVITAVVLFVLGFVKKNSPKQKIFFITAGAIAVFVTSFGIYVNYTINYPPVLTKEDRLVSVLETSKQEAKSDTEQSNKIEPVLKEQDEFLTKANEVLQSKNSIYKLSAVSKFDEEGFFGLDTSKGVTFVIYDKKDDMIARVNYDRILLKPRDNKYKTIDKHMPLIFKMYIENDNKTGEDSKLGVWNGNVHMVPIYALFEVDANNDIVPGMLYSAQGENPSHYQGVLKEQKNVNLANIVLTHADSLNEDIIKRNISLP